jgi:hypothetical protein
MQLCSSSSSCSIHNFLFADIRTTATSTMMAASRLVGSMFCTTSTWGRFFAYWVMDLVQEDTANVGGLSCGRAVNSLKNGTTSSSVACYHLDYPRENLVIALCCQVFNPKQAGACCSSRLYIGCSCSCCCCCCCCGGGGGAKSNKIDVSQARDACTKYVF